MSTSSFISDSRHAISIIAIGRMARRSRVAINLLMSKPEAQHVLRRALHQLGGVLLALGQRAGAVGQAKGGGQPSRVEVARLRRDAPGDGDERNASLSRGARQAGDDLATGGLPVDLPFAGQRQ